MDETALGNISHRHRKQFSPRFPWYLWDYQNSSPIFPTISSVFVGFVDSVNSYPREIKSKLGGYCYGGEGQ